MAFIRPSGNSTFYCHNPKGLKLITRLRIGLSHPRLHEFKYSFQNTLNLICNFSNEKLILFNKLRSIDANILSKDDSSISKVLLYGNQSFNDEKILLFTTSVEDIISTKRFDAPLFQN